MDKSILKRAKEETKEQSFSFSMSRTNHENDNENVEEYCSEDGEEVGELLKLTMGRTTGLNQADPKQIFICKYCSRKFYNPQALGGHQNAHKKERSVARYFANTHQFINSSYARALGVHTHSQVAQNPNRVMYNKAAHFSDIRGGVYCPISCALPTMYHQPIISNAIWPRSFHVQSITQPAKPPLGSTTQPAEPPLNQRDLDLNLKL